MRISKMIKMAKMVKMEKMLNMLNMEEGIYTNGERTFGV